MLNHIGSDDAINSVRSRVQNLTDKFPLCTNGSKRRSPRDVFVACPPAGFRPRFFILTGNPVVNIAKNTSWGTPFRRPANFPVRVPHGFNAIPQLVRPCSIQPPASPDEDCRIDARRLRDFGIGTYIRNLVTAIAAIDSENEYLLVSFPEDEQLLRHLPRNFDPSPAPVPTPIASITSRCHG